jgi:hypothetical protein
MIVDTTTTRSSSQLGVLRWSEELVTISSELGQFVDYDCSCWHVDAKSKRLCCENDPNESLDKTLFNCFFEWRNESSMMTGDTSLEGIKPSSIVEYPKIFIGEFLYMRLRNLSDSSSFLGCRETQTCTRAGSHRFVATVSAEHEEYCWEHRSLGEKLDYFNASRR